MMKLLSLFLLLAVLFSADAAKFRRLRGESSGVNNKYLDLASEVNETTRQRTRQVKKAEKAPATAMSMSMSMSMPMSMSMSM
jgi:hypothetical protein